MRVVLCDKQANDHRGGHSVSGMGMLFRNAVTFVMGHARVDY